MRGGFMYRNRGIPSVALQDFRVRDMRLTIPTDLAKLEADACGFPMRDRQTVLFSFIGVEIFTLLCVGLRICSRYRTGRWHSDDYLMVVILVRLVSFRYPARFCLDTNPY